MSKGTPSFGRHQRTTHMRCRRCGRYTYHKRKSKCGACGFGTSARILDGWKWKKKTVTRKRKD